MAHGPQFLDVGYELRPDPIHDENGDPRDISTATTKEVLVKRPSGAETTYTAEFDTDGKDGRLKYEATSGDLDENGTWEIQSHVILSDGSEYHGPVTEVDVHTNLSGGSGTGTGVSSHASRHAEGGADPLRVETLPSNGASGEVPIADGAGGLDMGPVSPGSIDSTGTTASDPLISDGAGGTQFTDGQAFADAIISVGPRKLTRSSETTYTFTGSDHWSWVRYTGTGSVTWSVPDTLPGGWIAILEVTSSGEVTVQGTGTLTVTGHTGILRSEDKAVLIVQTNTSARLMPIGKSRLLHGAQAGLSTGEITGDYTINRLDHGHIIDVNSPTPVTITVPDDLPPETEVYFDCVGAGDVTFAASGTQQLVGPGTTAVQGATVGVLVRSSTRAKLVGELS